jgi:hypothetical protein
MITVTLTFDTFAAAASALALVAGTSGHSTVKPTAPPDPTPPTKSKAEKTAKEQPVVDTQREAQASASAAAEPSAAKMQADASPAADEAPLDYDVLRKAVFELAAKSRDAASAVNAQFGVKTMKDLPEGQRREALAAVQQALADLVAEPA